MGVPGHTLVDGAESVSQTPTEPTRERTREGSAARSDWFGTARQALARHRLCGAAVLAGATVRVVATLGFRPAMWFNDGFEYVGVARRFEPYPIRPSGYSAFLRVLEPAHSFALVVSIQHLMGLAVAVMLYALLRRWGAPAWLAVAGVLPQLLDANQVQLEHVVLSDTLFTFLLVGAMVLLLWNAQPSWRAAALAGLLFAGASLTRSIGLPLLVVAGVWLAVRRVGWRSVTAYAGVALLVLAGYASWFKAVHGQFTLVTSDGVFLYSRVAIFADCDKIDPPQHLRPLCETRTPAERGDVSSQYLWHPSPLDDLPGVQQEPLLPSDHFSADRNGPAGEFALLTILAQPGDYLRVGWNDTLRTFQWGREPFPNRGAFSQYPFSEKTWPITDEVIVRGGTPRGDTTAYEHGKADTHLVQPYAGWAIGYQHLMALRGPFLAILMLTGALGLVLALTSRTPFRSPAVLMWTTAAALIVIPPFTAQYDFRYALPAVPLSGAVAALAIVLARERSPARLSRPAWLRSRRG